MDQLLETEDEESVDKSKTDFDEAEKALYGNFYYMFKKQQEEQLEKKDEELLRLAQERAVNK